MRHLPAERLAGLIADCAAAGVTRQALLLRLDRLPPALSRPHHHRLAEAALAPLLRSARAELFHLPGSRLAVTWRGEAEAALLEVVDALDHMLADTIVPAPGLRDLVFLYDLPENGDLLLAASVGEAEAAGCVEPQPPLDPASLILLESTLAHADISRFARRQPVWRLSRAAPALAWEQRVISLPELADTLLPGRDLTGEPWLYRRLTRTLDRRMLALLSSPGELASAGPFALELNVASLLGPEFLRFDGLLPAGLRGRVVLVLDPADVVADAAAFGFARAFAHARDYRLMLCHATPAILSVLSAAALDLDYLLLPWSAGLPGSASLLEECHPDQIVLDCADDPAALSWGMAAGVQMFTGAAADRAALGERASAA